MVAGGARIVALLVAALAASFLGFMGGTLGPLIYGVRNAQYGLEGIPDVATYGIALSFGIAAVGLALWIFFGKRPRRIAIGLLAVILCLGAFTALEGFVFHLEHLRSLVSDPLGVQVQATSGVDQRPGSLTVQPVGAGEAIALQDFTMRLPSG
jgi:hypothetical protein